MNPPETWPHTLHFKRAVPESRRTVVAEQLTPHIPNMTLEHFTRLLSRPETLTNPTKKTLD